MCLHFIQHSGYSFVLKYEWMITNKNYLCIPKTEGVKIL